MVETADDARTGCDVGEEKAPSSGGAERRRKNHGGVGIERAGRGGKAGEFSYAESYQENCGRGQNISEPSAVTG